MELLDSAEDFRKVETSFFLGKGAFDVEVLGEVATRTVL